MPDSPCSEALPLRLGHCLLSSRPDSRSRWKARAGTGHVPPCDAPVARSDGEAVTQVRTRSFARLGAPLVLLTVCALARPASAHVFVRLEVADKLGGTFGQQASVLVGQKFTFRVSTLNVLMVPLVAVCDIPLLKFRVSNVLLPFRVKEILFPGKVSSMTLAAICNGTGTATVTAFVLFVNPFTGCFCEVADSVVVVCEESGVSGGKKDGTTGSMGGGQEDGSIGELGGAGSEGTSGSAGGP
jgi:hypothetical protein